MQKYQEKIYCVRSVKETCDFGEALGEILLPDDVLALQGDLGAGKTTLTHGIAKGLKIKTPISSPTFTLLFEHLESERNISLYHFDAYRLSDESEWYDAGFMDYLDNQGVSVIEWAERVAAVLPERTIWLVLKTDIQNPDLRIFQLKVPFNQLFNWQNLEPWQMNRSENQAE